MRRDGILLGCIADDMTGATDLASNLVRAGMRVSQTIGVPESDQPVDAQAVVVALKSRTIPAAEAVAQSLQALQWLRGQGAAQIYFKYCSTFDSTAAGNIGPVLEALSQALQSDVSLTTPAFPDNHRTVVKGHLFVGDDLLSDSGMRHHPLTPMTDANLVRVLQAQCVGRVGLADYRVLAQGAQAVRDRLAQLRTERVRFVVADAMDNDDLLTLGRAVQGMPLVSGGSGLAIGLPGNWGIVASESAGALPQERGFCAVVSGSCSIATNRQVMHFIRAGCAALPVDPLRIAAGEDVVGEALAWARERLGQQPILVYSTADPSAVKAVQKQLGVDGAGTMVEQSIANIAAGLVRMGVGQLVVAGGETSGACVQALGIERITIGAQIDPGVPWCHCEGVDAASGGLHIALKSGNFGTDDFFVKAFRRLASYAMA